MGDFGPARIQLRPKRTEVDCTASDGCEATAERRQESFNPFLHTAPKDWPALLLSDVMRALEADGWREARSKGSHRHFRHPAKPGTVTVAVHGSSDLKRQDIASIERQADLKLRKD